MIIDNAGTYTLRYTATDDCGKTTTVDRELVVAEPTRTLFGIRSTSASSSACVRTDDSALFADPIPQHSDGNGGWVDGSSPFDNYMPWSGIEIVEDADAGTLVKIPKFWYKWTRNDDEMQLQISNEERTGFLVSPAHADRGDGVGERDVVYVGRYHCASDYTSKTSMLPISNSTISDFRNNIHSLGSDVWQYDFSMFWTIAMLYLVEFADWNSQAKIGGGCSDSGSIQNMGLTDSMTYHTGTTNTQIATDAYGHIQYRHIEDLWANVHDWCDGIGFNGTGVLAQNNPANYDTIINWRGVGSRPNTSGYVQTFNDPSSEQNYEYALYPSGIVSDVANSKTHDHCKWSNNSPRLYVGGRYTQSQDYGLFFFGGNSTESTALQYIGCRLMKLPNA